MLFEFASNPAGTTYKLKMEWSNGTFSGESVPYVYGFSSFYS